MNKEIYNTIIELDKRKQELTEKNISVAYTKISNGKYIIVWGG